MRLTNDEINQLLSSPKVFTDPFSWPPQRWGHKSDRKYRQASWGIEDNKGRKFRLILRINEEDVDDYSAVLVYRHPGGGHTTLLRCNGPSHAHRNKLQNEWLPPGPHVHLAREEYAAEPAWKIEGHAEPTDEFSDPKTAVLHLCKKANIEVPEEAPPGQLRLIEPPDVV